VAFEYKGMSFKTRPGQMVYVYRLEGYDASWRQTQERRVEYRDLPPGEYTFQVKAVDRDLSYSENPAQVRLTIHPPYGQIALKGGLGMALVGLVIASAYGIKRRRERDQARERLLQEMAKELQTAHDLQMGLMPREAPRLSGLEIAGRCRPANHVSGDLFQYFHTSDKLSLALADVTGHAMEAAIPVVMFCGVLRSQLELGSSLEALFDRLNRSLYATLTGHTFVCFTLGELEISTRILRLSNSGCPYPYHYRASSGEVVELRVNAYPLGIRPDTRYPVIAVQLEPGDWVVFCSDGIVEAANAAEELFGFERLAGVIREGCVAGLSATGLLERVFAEVQEFAGGVPQGDDQTGVVLKIEGEAPKG
jgi:sigma-B regulation protein RsbU (phosphoserine phosphatase)